MSVIVFYFHSLKFHCYCLVVCCFLCICVEVINALYVTAMFITEEEESQAVLSEIFIILI